MKKILFLAIVVISFSCSQKKQEAPKNSDLNADNLKGPVEQTTSTDFKVDSSGKMSDQDSCCVVTVKYNEKGYISDYSSADKSGENVEKGVYSHYDNGAMKDIKMSKNGKQTNAISISVDKDGKYSGAQEFDSSNKLEYYYADMKENDFGGLAGLKQYKPDSTLKSSMTSTFDSALRTGGESMDSVGKVIYSSSQKLDDNKNVIEETSMTVTKDSTINKVTTYKYDGMDANGNWTEKTEIDANGKPVKITKREITYYK
ncbi:MAG: hypothetical protein ABIR50_08115 [Ginsengibacter sp.]